MIMLVLCKMEEAFKTEQESCSASSHLKYGISWEDPEHHQVRSSEHQRDIHRSPSLSGYSTGSIYTHSGRALAQCSSANVPLSTDKGASRAPRGRQGMCMQYIYCHGRRLGPVLMKRHYFQCCFGSTGHSFSSPHDKHKSCVRLCTELCCNFSLLDYDVHQAMTMRPGAIGWSPEQHVILRWDILRWETSLKDSKPKIKAG